MNGYTGICVLEAPAGITQAAHERRQAEKLAKASQPVKTEAPCNAVKPAKK